jgi:hypothetical protein
MFQRSLSLDGDIIGQIPLSKDPEKLYKMQMKAAVTLPRG